LCAQLHPAKVAHLHHGAASVAGAHDDVLELLGVGQAAQGVDLQLERLACRDGRLAELSGRDLQVLLQDSRLHVCRCHAELGEAVRVEPDPHGVALLAEDRHVAGAGQALYRVHELQVGVVAEADGVHGLVRGDQVHQQGEVRLFLLDCDTAQVDDGRELGAGLGHPVLHVHGGNIHVVADIEGDGDGGAAVVGADGGDVGHALHAVDLLFQRRGDGVGHGLGAGASIGGTDYDLRRRDLRELRDRQQNVSDGAGKHHDDGHDRGEDRPGDEEVYHLRPLLRQMMPGRTG